jgi:hypothetical protein
LAVCTGLGVLAYQLFGMVTGRLLRIAVAAAFPLLIFPPHAHRLLATPLHFASTPWAAAVMAAAIVLAVPRVLARPLPSPGRRG